MGEQKLRILSVAAHTHDCARPSWQPTDLDYGLPELPSPTLPTTPTQLIMIKALPQRAEVVVIGAGIVG